MTEWSEQWKLWACPDCGEPQDHGPGSVGHRHGDKPRGFVVRRTFVLKQEAEQKIEEAVAARREIESKLESGYLFCHPEEDCEGQRAWLKACEERDQALRQGAAEERERLRGVVKEARRELEGRFWHVDPPTLAKGPVAAFDDFRAALTAALSAIDQVDSSGR